MNKEYIEREVLIKELEYTSWYHITTHGNLVIGAADEETALYKAPMVMEVANKIPAADVEPVRHGKWEFIDYRNNGENITATCSNCHTRGKVRTNRNCFGMWYIDSPRCPCCGAKMDKE